jgi:exosortase
VASGGLLYGNVLGGLVRDWWTDDNYSHGFLIVPLALYFAYARRQELAITPPRPRTVAGGLIILGSLVLLAAGTLGSEFFLSRVSLLGALAGIVLVLYGAEHLRLLIFPIGFLALMIPIPAIVFNQIAFPLQMLASRFGEQVVAGWGLPVLREGNVIVLASTTLEVAEACSGIRSLVSLLTLGVVLGYFTDPRGGVRAAIALATIPIAIVANGLRVAGTGVAAHYFGPAAAEGFFHTFSGWLLFASAFLMLLGVVRLVRIVTPGRAFAGAVASQTS